MNPRFELQAIDLDGLLLVDFSRQVVVGDAIFQQIIDFVLILVFVEQVRIVVKLLDENLVA